MKYEIPQLPLSIDIETKRVLKQLIASNKALAELKGVAQKIPNEQILISTLTLQEAFDSSAIENIITTQDELYRADVELKARITNASTKEVLNYREALQVGFEMVRKQQLITKKTICKIQETLEHNNAGFRKVPDTLLKNQYGDTIYEPPQDGGEVEKFMDNLELFINDNSICDIDPLIKMAIIHHQFESIHPFYDGNGRTGRIINILYLVANNLLDLPILYLSRYITHHKTEYYQRIQNIRAQKTNNAQHWEEWILFILRGVEETATETIHLVESIFDMMNQFKQTLRPILRKQYKHELLNNLFSHPYTKIEFIERDMQVSRLTATKYLDNIVAAGLLTKQKIGNTNYYINHQLVELFLNVGKE